MHGILERIRLGVSRFYAGRYGSDKLNLLILGLAAVLSVVNLFVGSKILSAVSFVLIVLFFLRSLSRNIPARERENRKFLGLLERLRMRKTHHIYRCPECRQLIRVPRKGGKKVEIRCPKCSATFIKTI